MYTGLEWRLAALGILVSASTRWQKIALKVGGSVPTCAIPSPMTLQPQIVILS